jgi:hypothetical protein
MLNEKFMKKICFILTIFLIITSDYAQVNEKSERQFYKQGDWEFGFSSNIGSRSEQTKGTSISYYSYDNSQYFYTYDYTEKGPYLNLGVSIGFYLLNGLSIEPELNLNSYAEGFSASILGNLCYTIYLQQKNIYPYLKLGYGLSSDPENSDGLFEPLDFKTINAGAGLKFKYSLTMAFRIEMNYRNINGSHTYSYSDQYSSNSTNYEITTSIISFSLGISILL